MTSSQICILITMIAYLILMIIIGVQYSKKTKNVGDFYLGGRELSPLVAAMSAEASDMSSYLLMGLPGLAYLSGMCDVTWTIIGLAVGTYLNWLIVAKRLRNYSAKINAITIPDFFAKRYNNSKAILGVSALIIVIFFIPYTGSGFSACGKLFGTLFGMDYHTAMIISAIIIILYTCLGGFNAASTTDFIQSVCMTLALLFVLIFGVIQAGGIDSVITNAKSFDGYFSMNQTYDVTTNSANAYGPLKVISTLAWGLGYFGMPHILLRFMAIKDPEKVKLSRRVASIWVVISMAVAVFIGMVGLAMSNNGKIESLADSETVVIAISNLMSTKGIFLAFLAGIVCAGILACTMSTSDSQLLAASSSVSENIMTGVFGLKLDEKKKMLVARTVLVIIAVIGVIIAWNPDSSVFGIVSFAWAGFGAAFGPLMLLALFWKRSNKYGAIAGLIAGGVMVFVWKYGIAKISDVLNIYELLPAFITNLIVNIVVSLCTKAPDQETIKTFDEVKAGK